MKTRWLSLAIALVALMVLASCAPAPTPTSAPPPTQAPAVIPPTAVPPTAISPTAVPPTQAPAVAPTPVPPTQAPAAVQPTAAAPAAPTQAPAAAQPTWQADGVIQPDEYAHTQALGEVTVHWRNDGKFLYFALEGATKGWIAMGLDPETRMQGANFILGFVKDGQAQVFDAYGQGQMGPTHPADDTIGGKNDIVAYAGAEEGDLTRFEVQIPLDSGDQYDKPLAPGGTYAVIVALGSGDEFNARHTFRGGGQITLD